MIEETLSVSYKCDVTIVQCFRHNVSGIHLHNYIIYLYALSWVSVLSYYTYMQFIRFDLFSDSVTACCCARGCNALNHCAIEDLFLSLISLVITESDSVLLRDVVEAHWLAWSMRLSSGVNYSCIQTALILQTHRHQSGELRDGNEMWWVSFSMQSKWKALGFCWDGSI